MQAKYNKEIQVLCKSEMFEIFHQVEAKRVDGVNLLFKLKLNYTVLIIMSLFNEDRILTLQ